MKTPRPDNFETMAMDGWIRLEPGEAVCFDIDTSPRPSLDELRDKMRNVRGMVLAAGFTIENNMVLVQLADAFGTTDRRIGGQAFGEAEDYLRSETTGIERRLGGAKTIIRRTLGSDEGDAIVQDLAEYRRVRHLCAHRPCWLAGIWDPDAGTREGTPRGRTIGFRLFVADAHYIWEIDDDQINEWVQLLNRVAAAGDRVLRSILKIDERGQPIKSAAPSN